MSFELTGNQGDISARREKMEAEIQHFRHRVGEKFPQADAAKIIEALDFMLKIHLPQKDRVDGRPFASHPLAVAAKVMELSDNPELAVAALTHDTVEDQSDRVFVERINRKYPDRDFVHLKIDETAREKYKDIFKTWSLREIKDKFGDQVKYYVENLTNHDFNSLAEDMGLSGDKKTDFINKLYAEHVEDLLNDPELFTLKLADLSTNINLRSLDQNGAKYQKLKRKYKSVIETILEKLKNLETNHLLYAKKDGITSELEKVYHEQYA